MSIHIYLYLSIYRIRVRVGGRATRERLKPTALRQVTNRLYACIYIHIDTHIYTYLSISVYLSLSSARRRAGDA